MSDTQTFEHHSRVMFNLPFNGGQDEKALAEVIRHFTRRKTDSISLEELTLSEYPATSFNRYSSDKGKTKYLATKVIFGMVDVRGDTPGAVSDEIREIREHILKAYNKHTQPLTDVWIVAHQVVRYA